eukprot:g25656.t1
MMPGDISSGCVNEAGPKLPLHGSGVMFGPVQYPAALLTCPSVRPSEDPQWRGRRWRESTMTILNGRQVLMGQMATAAPSFD